MADLMAYAEPSLKVIEINRIALRHRTKALRLLPVLIERTRRRLHDGDWV